MLTSIHLIRAACDATELSDAVVRGTANAARALCTWAADPSVPESTAAPVVTEAVHRVTSVLEHAESQHAHPPSACAMEELRTSLVELRSFLNEDSSEHSSVQSVASRGSDCQLIDREIVEKQNAAHTAAMHLRIIVVVLFVLVVGCTVAIVAIGISKMRDYESENRRLIISDLLTVAVSALDALYPLLQEAGVDVKYSGVAIAADLLEELSSARGDMYSNQTMFFSSKSSLFEYRAGTQNFMQSGRVTAVTTPRTYGLLCRQNLSLPYKPEDDVSHDRTYILPDLTPNQCANDATAHGVFSGVTPPYTSFSPYVETYRRNGARLSNYYHQGFATSIAVTQDYETLQNFLVPSKTTFGTLDPFSNDFGDWKGYLTRWLALLLAGSLCLFLGAVELLTLLHFQHHRLLVAVILGGLVGGTLALAKTIVETSINNATSEMESTGAGEMCRCLAAALTSSTLEKYNAITSFYQQVAQSSLNGRVFFMFNDASSDNAILPSFMANTAKAINAASLNEERLAQDIGFANGYCYASFFYLAKEMFAVYVEEEDHHISANGAAWIASGAAVVALFFVLGYLRFSPLFKLAADGRGSPLLQRLGKQHVRLVLYIVMHVAIISSMAGLNAFGTTCVNSVTKDQASDTLEMLGSTNRAYSLVNNCQGSCGLPSTMTTLLFNLVNDAASLLYTYTPYPIYEGAWEDHYYGAQLALTRLPAVLQNMLSFATPLLNLTSGQIEPRYLQRRMLAAVDVNSTSGFVLERLPSSTLSPLFAFCSQSIGLCLGIGVVSIGVCAMEWIYTRMGRLCRERQSLRRSYAIMIGIVIVASLMVMVNAIIMKFEIHRAVEDFAEAELSLQCRSVNSRLEPITLNGYLKNLSPEAILDTIVAATLNASDNIQLGVSFYSRLRIFQEYPLFGSNRVLIRGGGLVANTTYPLPALTTSTVPQCASNMGEEFSATAPNRKLYCYSQLMTMMNETYKAPRMFIVAIREYDQVVANPAWTAWLQLIRVSATVCGVLIMFLLLVLWWTMDTAHRSGYALYGETEMASASLPWPRQFAVVDHRMPARRRLLWLACSVVGLMIVLMYYTVSLSELIDELDLANSLVVPYATQNGVSVSMTNTAMDDAYNYVRFPDEGGTSGVIAALATSVAAGTAQYQFSVPAYRDDYVAALNNMYNTITGATLVKSYAEQGLTASGFDSYSSLVANQYMNFIKAQTAVLELLLTLYSTLSIFLSPQENFPFYTDEVPAVLLYCELLTDVMQKLFVLDHMAVASFLEFTPTSSTNNDLCPFNSTPEEMATMVTNTQSAYALLVEQVDERIEALITASVVLMSTSSVLSVFSNTINNVKRTYPTAVALSNLAGPLWTSQGDRCQDVSFAGNASMEARVTSERESVLDDLVTQQEALIVAYAKDAAYRKSVQMIEFIDSGEDLSRMENVLAWERVRMANNVKHKVVVAFACTLSLFVVLVFVSGVWYWVQRNGVEQLLKSADEAAPLRRASKPYSEQDATDDGQTRGSIRLVLPFVIGALMAVIPICCAYWLMWKMLDKSVNTMPGVEVTAPYIALYQQTFVTDVEAFLVESSIQLQNSSLNAVKDSALLFALAFNSLYHEGADINSNITSSIAMFTQYGSEALACAKKEVYMNSIAVNVLNMKSYASSLTAYAREVLLTMDATDNYSLIVPVGVSGSTTVGSALSIELFTQALGLASHTQVTSTTLFDPYTKQIQTLNTASKAYLNMWHVVVSGAAKGGETVATTYWNFESLVGTAALQPLSTSGASSAAGAVTGITTFFAPLLAVATSETAVDTLFTTTTAVTTETGPVSSYLDAAYASSYLSSIVTAATVTNMYAYNRGLTTKSVELNGETPLITYLNNMISISEYLITTGLSNSYYTYTLQPATKNEWIWATEVTGIRTITSIYDEASYIDTAMQWCCVSAFWIIFLVAIFCAYKLLHLA